jgi:hypothetical protein
MRDPAEQHERALGEPQHRQRCPVDALPSQQRQPTELEPLRGPLELRHPPSHAPQLE